MTNVQIPDEALFFIADGYYSVNQLLQVIYNNPNEKTRNHFLNVNSHLKSGKVKPGQMVIITPPNANSCQHWEAIMQVAARQIDSNLAKMSERERKNLARHYALLNNITSYTSPLYGWVNNYFSLRVKQVESILQQIDSLYVQTYKKYGHLRSQDFFAKRKALYIQLNQAINGMMRRELFGQDVLPSKIKNQLGISTKATLHQWRMQGGADSIKGFNNNYHRLTRTAKTFSRLGYVAIGLDIIGGVANIHKACVEASTSAHCEKAKFTETSKTGASILGGIAAGGLVAYSTCNLLFGLETAGSSLVWCGIVAGAAGGYIGSKTGGRVGEKIGVLIYEASMR